MPIRGSPDGARHPRPQSRSPGMSRRDPSEPVVAINWNEWSRSIGTAGRDQPVRAVESSASWVSVSLLGDIIGISIRLTTASCAVTTEAPHWRESRRGRIP